MKTAPWIIIALLMLVILLQQECHHCSVPEPCPEPIIDTVYTSQDSIPTVGPQIIVLKEDSLIYVDKPIPVNIDSLAVARAFFGMTLGDKVIIDVDTSMFVSIRWAVEQNKLQWVKPTYLNKRVTKHQTTVNYINEYEPRDKVFVGFGITYDSIGFGLPLTAMYLTKRDHPYQLQVDPFKKSITLGTLWKITFKKRNHER